MRPNPLARVQQKIRNNPGYQSIPLSEYLKNAELVAEPLSDEQAAKLRASIKQYIRKKTKVGNHRNAVER